MREARREHSYLRSMLSIKLWAKKDGEFAGTCASQNPMINKDGEACGFCGKTPDEYKDCSEPEHA